MSSSCIRTDKGFLSITQNMDGQQPWKNGCFYGPAMSSFLFKVDGQTAKMLHLVYLDHSDVVPWGEGTWTCGDFGPARKDIKEASGGGIENYNIELSAWNGMLHSFGVVNHDGTIIYTWNMFNQLWILKWMSDDDLKNLADDREPVEAPTCLSKIQPENQAGKLVWISGPPGAGKSTTAHLMCKDAGYVHYEGDCTMSFINPAFAGFAQKPLKVCTT